MTTTEQNLENQLTLLAQQDGGKHETLVSIV